jgi:hypothetical protein
MTPQRFILAKVCPEDNIQLDEKTPYTHIVIPYTDVNLAISTDMMNFKLSNRNVKLLVEVHMSILMNMGIIDFIKFLTEYCFDGAIFIDVITLDASIAAASLLVAMSRLPAPYDFDWDFFVDFSSANSIDECMTFYKYLKQYQTQVDKKLRIEPIIRVEDVKSFTDYAFPHDILIVSDKGMYNSHHLTEFIKCNKLGGVYTLKRRSSTYYDKLKHSCDTRRNNVDYPTSKMVKELFANTTLSIIDCYTQPHNDDQY